MVTVPPPEILDACAEQLGANEIKSLRLVNWRWHDVATRALFRSVELRASDDSLKMFQRFTSNPLLQGSISQIVFNQTRPHDRYTDLKDMEHRLMVAKEKFEKDKNLLVEKLKGRPLLDAHETKHICKEHHASFHRTTVTSADKSALIFALHRLPGIRSVVLDDAIRPVI